MPGRVPGMVPTMLRRPFSCGTRSNRPFGMSARSFAASFRSCGEPAGRWPTATCSFSRRQAACESKWASSAFRTRVPWAPDSAAITQANPITQRAAAMSATRRGKPTRLVLVFDLREVERQVLLRLVLAAARALLEGGDDHLLEPAGRALHHALPDPFNLGPRWRGGASPSRWWRPRWR